MVGRRVNSFRCWSTGKSDFLLPERGWRFAGLQIPSMAYPPSSTVSYFNQICFISNLNDWLIVDGVFFVIRCITLLRNKTEKMKPVVYVLFLSKRCSVERSLYRPIHSRTERSDDPQNAPWPKLYRSRSSRNLYWVLLKFDPLRCMYALSSMTVHRESLSNRCR